MNEQVKAGDSCIVMVPSTIEFMRSIPSAQDVLKQTATEQLEAMCARHGLEPVGINLVWHGSINGGTAAAGWLCTRPA